MLLRGRMASHANDMSALMSAIMVLDYPRIGDRAEAIAADERFARPFTGDATELASALPEKFFLIRTTFASRPRRWRRRPAGSTRSTWPIRTAGCHRSASAATRATAPGGERSAPRRPPSSTCPTVDVSRARARRRARPSRHINVHVSHGERRLGSISKCDLRRGQGGMVSVATAFSQRQSTAASASVMWRIAGIIRPRSGASEGL